MMTSMTARRITLAVYSIANPALHYTKAWAKESATVDFTVHGRGLTALGQARRPR